MPKTTKTTPRPVRKNRKQPKIAFVRMVVPRENVETYLHEDTDIFLEQRRETCFVSLYGPFKRTA